MGNVLRGEPFFPMPQEFADSGKLRDSSGSATKLYLALYYFAQRHTAVRLECSNAELRAYTGLDTKSIRSARNELMDQGLIVGQKGALGVYTYILLNPRNREPLASPEGRTGLKRYHGAAKAPL